MAKRKADSLSSLSASGENKKLKTSSPVTGKKLDLLDNSDAASSSDESDGGVQVNGEEPAFRINQDYARRFEHNKKREELQRLEEKYQAAPKKINGQYGDKYDEDSASSDEEEEDDEGILATEELDAQISEALNAIRSKDPRVYKTDVTFYTPIEVVEHDETAKIADVKKQKPMYLSDYHRENLLNGHTSADVEEDGSPKTFAEEQDDLKRTLVKEMHAAVADSSDDNEGADGSFLVPKAKPQSSNQGIHPSRATKVKIDLDISTADKNPDTFLSNFMAARAWLPGDGTRFQPLESDDEEEDDRAEKFEEAYNLRFENSKGSNEVLKSYARDVIAAKSVRREEPSGRKKQRDILREKREAEKRVQEEERAQLRKLKIEEAEEKLKKIKKAAGLRSKALQSQEWMKFLEDVWDDENWESEMGKRFGDDYYAELDVKSDDETNTRTSNGASKKKVKKPEWDDDIDINDLVPEFDKEGNMNPEFTFSLSGSGDEGDESLRHSKTSKERQQEKQAERKLARIERKKLEELIDSKMDLEMSTTAKQPTRFHYRETSPTSFGLTARDILMAPDAALNEFAGLKKMATFRDAEKKRRDKKKLGKKARLRQWRKETFGNEDGPEMGLNPRVTEEAEADIGDGVDIVVGGRKKKRRSRKNRGVAETI